MRCDFEFASIFHEVTESLPVRVALALYRASVAGCGLCRGPRGGCVVESIPGTRSGAWVFKDTRMPVSTVFKTSNPGRPLTR